MNSGLEPLTQSGWEALYRRLERPLFNLAYRYVWQREEAQDVLHDAFLRVWTKRSTLRAETARFEYSYFSPGARVGWKCRRKSSSCVFV